MTGDWHIGRTSEPVARLARLTIDLADGTRVSLVDPRALAAVAWHPNGDGLPPLGIEATDPALDAKYLRRALARRQAPIKIALLDQRVVAGLGNIYAAEALWRARIDPRAPASSLSRERLTRLAAAIAETMRVAFESAGRYANGEGGRFEVYDRKGDPCRRCGATLRRIVQGARSTYYCPRCQRR